MRGLDVSVVIAANEADHRLLAQCLAHLEVQSYPAGRFEIVVCCPGDQDTRDRLEPLLRGCPAPISMVQVTRPLWANALNAGLAAAQGRWLLFLDEDLLAGPGLIEHHVRKQEAHGGRCAVVGFVGLHPHIDPATFTQWEVLCEPTAYRPGDGRPWHAWRAFNLSVPRGAVADAGGFDSDPNLASVTDLDLAYRLNRNDIQGFFLREATAFGLRPTTLEYERRRHYNLGYDTHALLARAAMPELRDTILGQAPRGGLARAWLELPVWEQLSTTLDPASARFRQLMRRILHMRAHQGYADAHAQRPRREFILHKPLPTPEAPPRAHATNGNHGPA